MKRDIIEEIIDIRGRKFFASHDLEMRFLSITNVLETEFTKSQNFLYDELIRHACTSTVAAVEAYTKAAIQELIDEDDECFANAVPKLLKDKFSIDYLTHIRGNKTTIGELIAHQNTISSLENIISIFETLLGNKIKTLITNLQEAQLNADDWPTIVALQNNYDAQISSSQQAFKFRHIFSHEFANFSLDYDTIRESILQLMNFTSAIKILVDKKLDSYILGDFLNFFRNKLDIENKIFASNLGALKEYHSSYVTNIDEVYSDLLTKWNSFSQTYLDCLGLQTVPGQDIPESPRVHVLVSFTKKFNQILKKQLDDYGIMNGL
ncbi:MAG: hypothetical protein J0I41_00175 [Filimonas sp.]|nr:hypothetical protein [Filimonas sp.]